MKSIEYWQLTETSDGRDSRLIGNFSSEIVAQHALTMQNTLYRSVTKHHILIFDTIDEFVDNTFEKVKQRALDKLTTQEKQVLMKFFQGSSNDATKI
jgi:hypothetical protein